MWFYILFEHPTCTICPYHNIEHSNIVKDFCFETQFKMIKCWYLNKYYRKIKLLKCNFCVPFMVHIRKFLYHAMYIHFTTKYSLFPLRKIENQLFLRFTLFYCKINLITNDLRFNILHQIWEQKNLFSFFDQRYWKISAQAFSFFALTLMKQRGIWEEVVCRRECSVQWVLFSFILYSKLFEIKNVITFLTNCWFNSELFLLYQ